MVNLKIFVQLFQVLLLMVLETFPVEGRPSESVRSDEIEPDSSESGEMMVPLSLIRSVKAPKNDVPGKPLDEEEIERAENQGIQITRGNDEDPTLDNETFQGDIDIPDERTLHYINWNTVSNQDIDTRNAITKPYSKWPNAQIPYVISSSYDENERAAVARAIGAFHKSTCIRFIPRMNNQTDYIYFATAMRCSSPVGRVGGQQTVNLGKRCFRDGIIMHELMHAVGFWHEQSRADRDKYIDIKWDNIIPLMVYNFNKYRWGVIQNLSVSYDTGSIMHYGKRAFAINRKNPTIIPKNMTRIGQRRNLSEKDILKLNKLYDCQCTGGGARREPIVTETTDITATTIGYITTTTTATATTISVGNGKCVDNHEHCQYWAGIEECQKNPAYMLKHCKKSCGTC